MGLNLKQGARERRIAAEAVNEIFVALKPALDAARPAADAAKFMEENRGLIAHIFGLACDRHRVVTEAEATRVFARVEPALADLRCRFDHVNRQFENTPRPGSFHDGR